MVFLLLFASQQNVNTAQNFGLATKKLSTPIYTTTTTKNEMRKKASEEETRMDIKKHGV